MFTGEGWSAESGALFAGWPLCVGPPADGEVFGMRGRGVEAEEQAELPSWRKSFLACGQLREVKEALLLGGAFLFAVCAGGMAD